MDYVLEHSRADIVVVGDSETLAKVGEILQFIFLISGVKVWESKAKLAAVIQYEGDDLTAGVLSWASLLRLGDSLPDSGLMIDMMVMMTP